MAAFFQSPIVLSKKDFTFFHQLFSHEIEHLLPVSSTIYFWEQDGHWLSTELTREIVGKAFARLPAMCTSLEPGVLGSSIILPIGVSGGDTIAVLVGEIDSGLLDRMSPEWLVELRDNVEQALIQVKKTYVYPETGLYSSRLLQLIWNGTDKHDGALFVLGVPEKKRKSTLSLVKLIQKVHLVEAMISGPVVHFGGDVIGVYLEDISRDATLRIARSILVRLKREGAPYVHIGITNFSEYADKSLSRLLGECWEALEIAERRGPFSLCETSYIYNRQYHPFAKPKPQVVRRLQRKWKGLTQFSLLMVRVEDNSEKGTIGDDLLYHAIQKGFTASSYTIPVLSQECFVLLPGVDIKKAEKVARKIKKSVESELKGQKVAVGISSWPCLDFSRTASIVNCRKALMHGAFYGPGSITVFDQISLNVSGDYYFDEGDYRKAMKDYRAGLRFDPSEVNLLNSLGVVLTEMNRFAEAIECFDLVLKKDTKDFMALVNKGFALRMLKKDEDALACLSLAKNSREFFSSPVFNDLSIQLGRLYNETGEYKKAIHVLEKMLSRNSDKPGYLLYSLLGEGYAATGKNKKAIGMLQKAVQHNPYDAKSLSILGELYCLEGEGYDIAHSLCVQAVNLDDLSWENWYRLANIRFKIQDYGGAQEAIQESLLRNRSAVEPLLLAGRIHTKQGDGKKAKRMFQNVLRYEPTHKTAKRELNKIS